MPANVFVGRVAVPPGSHSLEVTFQGVPDARREVTVDVASGGFAAVVVTEPR